MKKYYERRWLNKKDGRAYSIAEINQSENLVSAFLEIGDCYKSVTLDFSYGKFSKASGLVSKERADAFEKIDNLISSLEKFRDKLKETNL